MIILRGIHKKRNDILVIPVTNEEKELITRLFPQFKVARTMHQDSKRHHYYAVEAEGVMRAISDTNEQAAAIVAEFDKRRKLEKARKENARIRGG